MLLRNRLHVLSLHIRFVDKNLTLLRLYRVCLLIASVPHSSLQIRFLLFNKAFNNFVISVQEVSKESQELMRKALEEVCCQIIAQFYN